MGIIDNAKTFLVNVALKKAVQNGAKVAAAIVATYATKYGAEQYGIKIDNAALEAGMVVAFTAALEFLRNLVKQKLPSIGKVL
jgi:hypothetical protein